MEIIPYRKKSKINKICKRIGLIFFSISVKINDVSKWCLFKTDMKDSLLRELEDREKKVAVGKKIEEYDKGISDVISEPIGTLFEVREEVEVCYDIVENLYMLWRKGSYIEMETYFKKFDFYDKKVIDFTRENE